MRQSPDWLNYYLSRLSLLLLPLVLALGCVGGPGPGSLDGDALTQLLTLYDQEQASRRSGLQRWQVQGILELESETGVGRHRVEVQGEGSRRARFRVFGPFQQVALTLWLGEDSIHLVDASRKETVTVAADARGMAYLTGIWIEPGRLLEILTGMTSGTGLRGDSSDSLVTDDGEAIRLDFVRRLILERGRREVTDYSWQVVYTWPEPEPVGDRTLAAAGPAMPVHVAITLTPGSSRVSGQGADVELAYRLKKWRFPTEPFAVDWFDAGRHPPGFGVVGPNHPDTENGNRIRRL